VLQEPLGHILLPSDPPPLVPPGAKKNKLLSYIAIFLKVKSKRVDKQMTKEGKGGDRGREEGLGVGSSGFLFFFPSLFSFEQT